MYHIYLQLNNYNVFVNSKEMYTRALNELHRTLIKLKVNVWLYVRPSQKHTTYIVYIVYYVHVYY